MVDVADARSGAEPNPPLGQRSFVVDSGHARTALAAISHSFFSIARRLKEQGYDDRALTPGHQTPVCQGIS
jgi:hypothetical protein